VKGSVKLQDANGINIAVFLDTNVFVHECYDFSELRKLDLLKQQVKKESVTLIISSIVVNEVKKHIEKDVIGAVNKINKVLKEKINDSNRTVKHGISIFQDMADYEYLFKTLPKEKMVSTAISRFEDYIEDTAAEIVSCSGVDIDKVFEDYFCNNPPFESRINKKSEFPDAFMAAKLKKMAGAYEQVIVISDDDGFRKALCSEEKIVCYKDLGKLLDFLNFEHAKREEILRFIKQPDIQKRLEKFISDDLLYNEIFVEGLDFDRKGIVGGHEYDESFVDEVNNIAIKLLSIDDIEKTQAIITIACEADITVECSFLDEENSIWDSEVKGYIDSVYGKTQEIHHVKFDSIVTLDFISKDEISIASVDFDLSLDQDTRVERMYMEDEYSDLDFRGEVMDTLEDYYFH